MVKGVFMLAFSGFCFWFPGFVARHGAAVGPSSSDMRTMSGYAEADALRNYEHPEDVWCSGATPECPSDEEAWNSLTPTCELTID